MIDENTNVPEGDQPNNDVDPKEQAAEGTPPAEEGKETLPAEGDKEGEKPPAEDPKASEKSLLEKGKEDEKVPEGAPEKYEEFTLPEGFELKEEVKTSMLEVFKSNGVSQKAGQELIGLYSTLKQQEAAADEAAFVSRNNEWVEQVKAHKEIGGAKLEENLSLAKKVVVKYFGGDTMKEFNNTGLGNHPDILAGFVKIAKAIGSDTFEDGGTGKKKQSKSAVQEMYNKSNLKD